MATRKKFKTEVQQLLDLVIHSLYSKKEIFLRELVSNASDACDRLRFLALQDPTLAGDDTAYGIKISVDEEARTLTVSDNGIGMNRDEIEKNIGTIANSGTRKFLDEIKKGDIQGDSPEMIGRFGVGFYAAFMVADKVTVVTKRAGEDGPATLWTSTGTGTYTMDDAERAGRGTDVTLHLREGMDEYLDAWKIEKTIKQYSDYVSYPIMMDEEVDATETDDEGNPVEGAEPKVTIKTKTLNSMKAIWKRPKSEISEEDYANFYKAISHDFLDPLETIHYLAEGVTEFRALVYLPKKAPMDMYVQEQRNRGLHLYVRNVFISDECKELMPDYLRFVKGVVDSSDLPLNVSREMLQDDAIIRRIRKSVVGKILNTMAEMKEKREEVYAGFYTEFGKILKEGMHSDYENREKLQELMLFESTATEPGAYVSLKDYVARMPSTQTSIYYLSGDSRRTVENSPHLEAFAAKGIEVLFFTDAIDEWVIQAMNQYDEKPLVGIDRGDIDLDGDDVDADTKKAKEEETSKAKEDLQGVIDYLGTHLAETVKEVRLSNRLTESACCLVADQMGMNAHMERIMSAMGRDHMPTKRILELNPTHPLMAIMKDLHAANAEDPKLADYGDLLMDQALLTEGSAVKNPTRFAKLVSQLMVSAAKG